MKRTRGKTERSRTGDAFRGRDSNHKVDKDRLPLHEYLKRPDIEKEDPCDILDHLKSRSHEEVVPEMLGWYRSGDLWKVTMASTYFNHSNVPDTIEEIIHQVQSGNAKVAKAARRHLAQYGEIALRKAMRRLQGPNLPLLVQEIFSRMDGRVIPIVLKSLRQEPLTARMTVVRALAGKRNQHALPVLLDLVCEEMPVIQSWIPKLESIAPWARRATRLALN